MTCFEAQSLIIKYLNNELNDDELKAFLDHIDNCKECADELEIYYTVITGIKQLDADKELTNNFSIALKKRLTQSRNSLTKRKKRKYRKVASFGLVVLVLTPLFLGIESSQVNDKKGIVYTDAKKSDYTLKHSFSYDLDKLNEFVDKNKNDINLFIKKKKQEKEVEK